MDVSEALSSAFLVLFPYIHVETNNMVDQCLNFVKTRTDRSIVELLKADIKVRLHRYALALNIYLIF